LLRQGVHPEYVQELLGHASMAITTDKSSQDMRGVGVHVASAMEATLSRTDAIA
jgi:hypothetical protein